MVGRDGMVAGLVCAVSMGLAWLWLLLKSQVPHESSSQYRILPRFLNSWFVSQSFLLGRPVSQSAASGIHNCLLFPA
jgi:hypothetical protein